ncbi:MAG: S41 family peptidase [Planctomycetota bacterium]
MPRLSVILLAGLIVLAGVLPAQETAPAPAAPAAPVAPAPVPAAEPAPVKAEPVKDITNQELERKLELLVKVIDMVSKNYVDPINRERLVEGALRGIMAELDPHSNFLTKSDMAEMQIDLKGELEGIGVYITLDEDRILTVITPIEDMPAYKAGILAGDKILEIDGVSTKGVTITDAVDKIRGKRGTLVKLMVYHVDLKTEETLDVTRELIPILSVKDVKLVDPEAHIGYIRLTAFQSTSLDEMNKAVADLEAKGLEGLVLDLRDNGGGLLSSAIDLADLFLSKGVIVSVRGRPGTESMPPARASGKAAHTAYPIAILVNGYSASASEILSAALRDNQRAILVGEKTYGKGSVQKLITLDDGSGIKLTIQRYYTPEGISIDKTGIMPDVVEEMNIETKVGILKQRRLELIEANKNPEFGKNGTPAAAPAPAAAAPAKPVEQVYIDTQLRRAVDILKGVRVFREILTATAPAEAHAAAPVAP